MMTAETVLTKLCEDYAGLVLQALLFDVNRPQDDPQEVFNYKNLVHVYIKAEGSGIQAHVTLDDQQEYDELINAVNTVKGLEPGRDQILTNALTLVPGDVDPDEYYYAAGYISTVTTQAEILTVIFTFLFEDFQVFCSLDEGGETEDETNSKSYDYLHRKLDPDFDYNGGWNGPDDADEDDDWDDDDGDIE